MKRLKVSGAIWSPSYWVAVIIVFASFVIFFLSAIIADANKKYDAERCNAIDRQIK